MPPTVTGTATVTAFNSWTGRSHSIVRSVASADPLYANATVTPNSCRAKNVMALPADHPGRLTTDCTREVTSNVRVAPTSPSVGPMVGVEAGVAFGAGASSTARAKTSVLVPLMFGLPDTIVYVRDAETISTPCGTATPVNRVRNL